jgi:anti-sigma factor ChrR (cupin superfamily)
MKEKSLNSEDMEWKDAPGYPSSTKIKVLREEGEAKTFLLKLPSGINMEVHSHLTTEEHFVLEGEYQSRGKVYGPGAYRLIPAHISHGPFTTVRETIILVIRESPGLDQHHPEYRV